jgi:hypothetical protein
MKCVCRKVSEHLAQHWSTVSFAWCACQALFLMTAGWAEALHPTQGSGTLATGNRGGSDEA